MQWEQSRDSEKERYYGTKEDATDREIGAAAFSEESLGGDCLWVLLFRQKMRQLSLPAEKFAVEVKTDKRPTALTVKKIDETHGNPLALWHQMGAPVPALPRQIKEIKAASEICEEPLEFAYDDGKVTFAGELFVNDIWLVRMELA